MKKRAFSLFLALVLCLGLLPATALAAKTDSGKCGTGNVTWTYDYGTRTMTFRGSGPIEPEPMLGGGPRSWNGWKFDEGEAQQPTSIVVEEGITSLCKGCFYDTGGKFEYVTSITLPDSLTEIGAGAFSCCESLPSIKFPSGVIEISDYTFRDCESLTQFDFSNIKKIGDGAFWGTGLTSVEIPSSVESIGENAFSYCKNLTSITLPQDCSVFYSAYEGSPSDAFYACNALKHVYYNGTEEQWNQQAISKSFYLARPEIIKHFTDKTVGYFLIEDGVLTQYRGPGGDVVIPDGVTKISIQTFENHTEVTSLVIPASVEHVVGSFKDCTGLTSVTILAPNVQLYSTFQDCTSLSHVEFAGEGEIRLWSDTFRNCTSLTEITIPPSVVAIWSDQKNHAFKDSGLKTIRGVPGTAAETYAKTYNINFVPIDGSAPTEQPVTPGKTETAMPTNDKLTVNGVPQNPTVYKINDSNYFKIRDLAAVLNGTSKQFSVGYDAASRSVTATSGQGYAKLDTDLAGAPSGNRTATVSNDTIIVNGQAAEVEVYKIDGSNYFKLRDLGSALGFKVDWTAEQGIFIETE